ncbi:nucleolar complex-associated protein-domain-containing protein [Suillus fuscotomentosus]|uniref:Nucleolar complex-associated protein 3 n=1 Tax=Suillus fuscotomentosus TaxID=1912939 RepID=A0AAD4EIM5_9AGAM|nr:nucleolar complex-associated protein-domain-containing protein [Suillus fuscotomentosus]KAG1905689.1 nucleolar complex-associated protein-domain-containing protein [Suillus fuscotomentosus]
MALKGKKRTAPAAKAPSKKRKLQANSKPRTGTTQSKKGKERAADKGYIEVPGNHDDADTEDGDVSEEDAGLLEEFGDGAGFLNTLDRKGISTSKKETERLKRLNKPARRPNVDDDLPSIDSHDEDEEAWSSGIDDEAGTISRSSVNDSEQDLSSEDDLDSDAEMSYERVPRKVQESRESKIDRHIQGLPIKSADGRIHSTGMKIAAPPSSDEEDSATDESAEEQEIPVEVNRIDDVATGARFGRPAVIDVVGNKSRTARIQGAKDQIATICQEIIAEPENSLGLLRRLHTFSLEKITSPSHPEPVLNHIIIRKLAILSQFAVFKDIIPGYRIRALTEKEKTEKVSQMVARTREWEQGFVLVYQNYLRSLEAELKAKSELAEVALKCMCTLATEVTHFNFRTNLITCIVARLSKKSWDEASDLCMNTLISIFRQDQTGAPSLEAVQLLNRMTKERHFNVHPEVLTCLLHLRLKTELNIRASDSKVDKHMQSKGKAAARRAKGKSTEQPHLSKKAQKVLKERKEIEREMRDAEAEVDKEERANTHTETLKLLFVLYFRILKHPRPTSLLPAALRGISKFAHLINIDFFKDLMQVLKDLILRDAPEEDPSADSESFRVDATTDIQHRLLCIVTAFELLSGQGEALNIDLTDFINHLYAIILPVSVSMQVDAPPPSAFVSNFGNSKPPSTADMLFRALNIVFSPRSSGNTAIHWRSAAFSKRLLIASLNWPPSAALRALEFVESLVAKDPKLEALLSTEDRRVDGVYRPEVDDPQLCHPFGTCFWELSLLQQHHYDSRVRDAARSLSNYTRS